MTIIEFLDKSPIENVISGLTIEHDKIIFLGDQDKLEKFNRICVDFFNNRHISTNIRCIAINKNFLQKIITIFESIIQDDDVFLVDLAGGDDLSLVALGICYEKYKNIKKIELHRFNILNGVLYDCDGNGNLISHIEPTISVKDIIMLHGGYFLNTVELNKNPNKWFFNASLMQDIETLWNISKKNPGKWNFICGVLASAKNIQNNKSLFTINQSEIIKQLLSHQFITYKIKNNDILVDFKNDYIKECLTSSGLILELKTFLTFRTITDKNERHIFSDVVMKVNVEWNQYENISITNVKTTNEIDVMAMKGLIPYFISCKNGMVDSEELYKLNTVANEFGDEYAKKILILARPIIPLEAQNIFFQRAKDMDIDIIYNVNKLTNDELERKIQLLISK